jgi:hypothetical protein
MIASRARPEFATPEGYAEDLPRITRMNANFRSEIKPIRVKSFTVWWRNSLYSIRADRPDSRAN